MPLSCKREGTYRVYSDSGSHLCFEMHADAKKVFYPCLRATKAKTSILDANFLPFCFCKRESKKQLTCLLSDTLLRINVP